jgi:hypothetical protein
MENAKACSHIFHYPFSIFHFSVAQFLNAKFITEFKLAAIHLAIICFVVKTAEM